MSEWEVYWWLMLDNIKGLFPIFVILPIAFSVLFVLVNQFFQDTRLNKLSLVSLLFLFLAVPFVFIPSSKQYAVIKVLPKIVNSDFAKEASGDAKMIYDVARDYLKETLKVEAQDAKG